MLPSGIYNTANFWFFFINMYHTIVLRNEMKKIDLSFFFCAEKIFFLVVFFYNTSLVFIYLLIIIFLLRRRSPYAATSPTSHKQIELTRTN